MTIDSKQAAEALTDIEAITQRVRQSRTYRFASLMMIMWGALTAAGYLASHFWSHHAGFAWIAVYVTGIAGSFAISAADYARSGVRTFDVRMFTALVLFFAFGFWTSSGLAHFTPRQLGAFWPIYFMLVYSIVGLWMGSAFVAIGFGITALTLVGYFYSGAWFDVWMAVINGGGLILGGFWMRRD
jgi:hypothetical protein